MRSPLLEFGAPPDAVAWTALALAAIAFLLGLRTPVRALIWVESHPRLVVGALAAAAAAISALYVEHYLRGGPRIIDATSYFLEARALSSGTFGFEVPEPSGSFRGRFLITPTAGTSLGVIFPPGYPAVLAIGFLLGAPLAVGPAIAAAIVVVSYALSLELFGSVRAALVAALLSVLCAALRYHTADTMSHGLGALLFALALYTALRGGRLLLVTGLAIGWLVATRPVTALAAIVPVLFAVRSMPVKRWPLIALGAVPGIAFFVLYQRAITGSFLESAQLRYYALADGPPGCFRMGFGSGIGCVFEHGDVVRTRLQHGFGLLEAAGTTVRRLHHHLLDVANFEPLALLVVVAAAIGRRDRGVRLLALGVLSLVVAYVPFYFDATYPGGGARVYAEALPLEHVLIAWLLTRISLARWLAPTSLLGFAVHASFSHLALREREGGRPMFEPRVLARSQVRAGLVFVGTDHGFNLGHQPGNRALVIARQRGDGHDRLLWERLGRPPAFRYAFDPWTRGAEPSLWPYTPPPSTRYEAEAQWPLLMLSGGYAHPGFPAGDCASAGRALRLVPTASGALQTEVEIVAPGAGTWRLETGWAGSGEPAQVQLSLGAATARGQVSAECTLIAMQADLPASPARVGLRVSDAPVWLDYVELRSATPTTQGLP